MHGELQSAVVGIDRLGVGGAADWTKGAGGGEQWFDGFVTEKMSAVIARRPLGSAS